MKRIVLCLSIAVLVGCAPDLIRECDRTMVPINAPAVVQDDAKAQASTKDSGSEVE